MRGHSCNEQGCGEGLDGFKGGWARGHLCEREGAKRLVGPQPEGPCELTGDELGAAVSEGSRETGRCVVTGAKTMSGRKLEGDTNTHGREAPACLAWGGILSCGEEVPAVG